MTQLEKAVHLLHKAIAEGEIHWRDVKDTYYQYIYCENRVYLIRHRLNGALHIQEGKSPLDACDKL